MSETERLDLDTIFDLMCKVMGKKGWDSEVARRLIDDEMPALVARVRELEAECNRMGEILLDRGCDKVVSDLVAAHDLLARVLAESVGEAGFRAALSHQLIDEITEAL